VVRLLKQFVPLAILMLLCISPSAGAEGIQTLQPPGAPYCDDFDPTV
jgi:hypothetical protein